MQKTVSFVCAQEFIQSCPRLCWDKRAPKTENDENLLWKMCRDRDREMNKMFKKLLPLSQDEAKKAKKEIVIGIDCGEPTQSIMKAPLRVFGLVTVTQETVLYMIPSSPFLKGTWDAMKGPNETAISRFLFTSKSKKNMLVTSSYCAFVLVCRFLAETHIRSFKNSNGLGKEGLLLGYKLDYLKSFVYCGKESDLEELKKQIKRCLLQASVLKYVDFDAPMNLFLASEEETKLIYEGNITFVLSMKLANIVLFADGEVARKWDFSDTSSKFPFYPGRQPKKTKASEPKAKSKGTVSSKKPPAPKAPFVKFVAKKKDAIPKENPPASETTTSTPNTITVSSEKNASKKHPKKTSDKIPASISMKKKQAPAPIAQKESMANLVLEAPVLPKETYIIEEVPPSIPQKTGPYVLMNPPVNTEIEHVCFNDPMEADTNNAKADTIESVDVPLPLSDNLPSVKRAYEKEELPGSQKQPRTGNKEVAAVGSPESDSGFQLRVIQKRISGNACIKRVCMASLPEKLKRNKVFTALLHKASTKITEDDVQETLLEDAVAAKVFDEVFPEKPLSIGMDVFMEESDNGFVAEEYKVDVDESIQMKEVNENTKMQDDKQAVEDTYALLGMIPDNPALNLPVEMTILQNHETGTMKIIQAPFLNNMAENYSNNDVRTVATIQPPEENLHKDAGDNEKELCDAIFGDGMPGTPDQDACTPTQSYHSSPNVPLHARPFTHSDNTYQMVHQLQEKYQKQEESLQYLFSIMDKEASEKIGMMQRIVNAENDIIALRNIVAQLSQGGKNAEAALETLKKNLNDVRLQFHRTCDSVNTKIATIGNVFSNAGKTCQISVDPYSDIMLSKSAY